MVNMFGFYLNIKYSLTGTSKMRTHVLRLNRTKKFLDSLFGHLIVAYEGLGMVKNTIEWISYSKKF